MDLNKYDKTIIVNFVAKHSYAYEPRMMEGLIHNNCRVIAIASKNMPEIEEWKRIKGLKIYEVNGYTSAKDFIPNLIKYLTYDAPRIRKIAEKYNVSSVFAPIFTYWSYFINKSLKKYPYIYTLHDPIPHSSKSIIHNSLNEKLVKKAFKVVILSESFKDYTCKHYNRKSEDVLVIPEGTNVQVDKGKAIRLVDYRNENINFVFQGRIDKYKGINVLISAYKKLSTEYKNITLTVAGSGDMAEYQEALNALPNCTIINRWLSNQEVVGLFNDKNTVAVLPYISATQSGVINVAMPLGTPIIASNTGALSEQIEDGKTGYLVTPGDIEDLYKKMKYVVSHRNELDTIRKYGYEHMKELDWDKLAARMLEIL